MHNGNIKRITIVIFAVSALYGAVFWHLNYERVRIIGHKIARRIDSLPARPETDRQSSVQPVDAC